MSRYLRMRRRPLGSGSSDAVLLWHVMQELQRGKGLPPFSIRHRPAPSPDDQPLALLIEAERKTANTL